MAIEIFELDRRVVRGRNPRAEIEFSVKTTDSENDAAVHDAIADATAAEYDIYGVGFVLAPRDTIEVRWICGSIDNLSAEWWARVTYQMTERAAATSSTTDPADYEFSFQVGGNTTKVIRNLELRNSAPSGLANPADNANEDERTIGVTKDGVSGTDIFGDEFAWSETHIKPIATIDAEYGLILRSANRHLNEAEFRGWQRGEVFIKSITGRHSKGDSNVAIIFDFMAKRNRVEIDGDEEFGNPNLSISGTESEPAAYGWDFVEVRTEERKDAVTKQMIVVPKFIYVHRVYDFFDFDELEIGA